MKNSTINQAVKKAIKDLKKLNYKSKDWNDKTPIYIDKSRSDSHKISYITTKKRNELKEYVNDFKFDTTNATRKKYFFHTSPSKLLQKFFECTLEFNDYDTSKVLKALTQRLYKAQNIGETFKSHTAEEIPRVYNRKSHEIVGSCMQEKPLSYFELYTCFTDNLKLYAEYNKEGALIARALFWYENNSYFLDRIYINTDDCELKNELRYKFYRKVMKAENIKDCNAYDMQHIRNSKLRKEDELQGLQVYPSFSYLQPDTCIDNLNYYPYMDTFQYIDDSGNITDDDDDTSKKLTHTDGTFEDSQHCDCEHCGYQTDRDSLIYVEDEGIEVCEDCAVYSEADGVSYLADNCTYIGGSVESYVLTEDIH